MTSLILASSSEVRGTLLRNAGFNIFQQVADIDERALEEPLIQSDFPVPDIAIVLAEAKAQDVSADNPHALVVGADQTLSVEEGATVQQLHKTKTMEDARRQLLKLQGKTHSLHSAVCCVLNGEVLFRYQDDAHLTMRPLRPEEVGRYLSNAGDEVLGSVGCYHMEGLGIRLFEKIEGDYFTILGLPLLPLLNFFQENGYQNI